MVFDAFGAADLVDEEAVAFLGGEEEGAAVFGGEIEPVDRFGGFHAVLDDDAPRVVGACAQVCGEVEDDIFLTRLKRLQRGRDVERIHRQRQGLVVERGSQQVEARGAPGFGFGVADRAVLVGIHLVPNKVDQ